MPLLLWNTLEPFTFYIKDSPFFIWARQCIKTSLTVLVSDSIQFDYLFLHVLPRGGASVVRPFLWSQSTTKKHRKKSNINGSGWFQNGARRNGPCKQFFLLFFIHCLRCNTVVIVVSCSSKPLLWTVVVNTYEFTRGRKQSFIFCRLLSRVCCLIVVSHLAEMLKLAWRPCRKE